MDKEELYELALSDTHKYNLLNEIFAIRDKSIENVNYTIGVDGFISLDVLNQYVNKIKENTNLKQSLNKIKDYVNSDRFLIRLNEPKINNRGETHYDLIRKDILEIIDNVGDDNSE